MFADIPAFYSVSCRGPPNQSESQKSRLIGGTHNEWEPPKTKKRQIQSIHPDLADGRFYPLFPDGQGMAHHMKITGEMYVLLDSIELEYLSSGTGILSNSVGVALHSD